MHDPIYVPLRNSGHQRTLAELGRKLGVLTPFCDAVLGLLRQRAANIGLIAG
jgi:hypothetical protein